MKLGKGGLTALMAVLLLCSGSQAAGTDDIREIGSRRELFVDRFLIDHLEGVDLELHEPRPADVASRSTVPGRAGSTTGTRSSKRVAYTISSTWRE